MRRVDPANMNPEAGLPLFEAMRDHAADLRAKAAQHPPVYHHVADVPPSAPGEPGFRIYTGGPDFGAIARDEGAAAALDAEARKHELAWAVKKAAGSFPTFTSDEVRDILKAELGIAGLDHPNALGAAFLAAARAGIIEPTDQVRRSTRDDAHRRKLTVWRSKLVEARP